MGKYKIIPGVYSITNIINGKRYIGHSRSIKRRWRDHRYDLKRGISAHTHLQSAWNLYGRENFEFSILEILPSDLTTPEYEKVETKWVLHFKSHLSDFGYNGVLPGSIPSKAKNRNKTEKKDRRQFFICISTTGEIIKRKGAKEVCELTGIKSNRLWYYYNYWNSSKNNRYRSYKGWIVIKKEDYKEDFDYINYHHPRKQREKKIKQPTSYKKNPKDIIPYEERKLKRVSIIAVNIETGEEKYYSMIKECYSEFKSDKVQKCLKNPFMKYKHRGCYFKYT